jgi:hypothetical protein
VAAGIGGTPVLVQCDVSPLDSLNANICYDLVDKLNNALGNENDSNPYIDFPLNSQFHDLNSFTDSFSGKNKFQLLSLNIHSLMCNNAKLSNLLSTLGNK